jgi:hypothetical protein
MKRAWKLGYLAVLALLVVQPAMAAFACAPLVGANSDCVTCPSSVEQMGDCPQLMATVVQGQNSCCQLDVPDSTRQVLVDRFTRDQGIGPAVMERSLSQLAPPTLQGLELDHGRSVPLPAASFQSLYCTFLI